jgi:cytochrome c-type biogenesis protein CcmH
MGGPTGVDWLPALLVLGAGLVVGMLLVFRVLAASRKAAANGTGQAASVPLELRDLEGRRDALLRQLRELEDTAVKRTAEQLAIERYALELEGARTLLELDERSGALGGAAGRAQGEPPLRTGEPIVAAAAEAMPARGFLADRPGLRGFLWGAGSFATLGLVVFIVAESAKPRQAGDSVTGDIGPGGRPPEGDAAGGEPPSDSAAGAEEAQLRERIARNPDDLEARVALSRVYLGRRDMMKVWNETKYVLERSPGDPRALSYQALVRVEMGQPEVARDMLQRAIAGSPDELEAYLPLALVYLRLGQEQEAAATIATASRRFPDHAASLQRFFEEMKTAGATAPAASEGDPHASVAPPGAGAAAPSAGGKRVSGVVELDAGLQGSVTPQAVLFVFVREAGFGAGPPVAARRIAAPSFPVRFEIGEGDAMMGQPFPDELLVEARLDSDGDPTTRPPSDPKTRLDDVKVGRTDVRLVLGR